jgi:hypothetical protein
MKDKDTHTNVLVRMTNTMKADLQREAFAVGQTLTAEINQRLLASFRTDPVSAPRTGRTPYPTGHQPAANHTGESDTSAALSDMDRAMLKVFHTLPVEKQLALLSLFK